ncbi:MAG: HAD-IIB family hydrolase, partial [Deltaproteobacteria bacterium]|nr:HAD-IIB family hydrolase [Deltaproteobacteria bacterium]
FTDLDGTLLDHDNYSFASALPAITILKEKNVPLIFCTSKTRAEIEEIQLQLDNLHPFISENGGALFIPKGYFSHRFHFTRENSHYLIVELGTPYPKLREVLNQMNTLFPGKLRGFGDLTPQEVADFCGLSLSQATLAKKRDYDEPFILEDESLEDALEEIAIRSHLQINRGGRFYHLIGNSDKGKAVLQLRDLYGQKSTNLKTVALGDSLNDLPMLKAVEYPILVQKPDGSYDPSVKLDNLILAPGSGPEGWCRALLKLLNEI